VRGQVGGRREGDFERHSHTHREVSQVWGRVKGVREDRGKTKGRKTDSVDTNLPINATSMIEMESERWIMEEVTSV
jgi:hypothetical protein